MNDSTNASEQVGYVSGKLIASLLVIALLMLGVIGLVLPILPGLVFLAIAAFVAARHFPWIDSRLRRHRMFGKHLDAADRFQRLSFPAKARVTGWYILKAVADGLSFVAAAAARLAASIKNG